jgi:2-polyprenyl-6-methoxyphenol hydroxylase-like FAD-dependent oxidoreductase
MESSDDLYFDTVSQIRMDRWSSGRVALVGDACFCPSLLAGQGSAFAMAGAYLLASELRAAGGDQVRAFARYEERFRPFIEKKQKGVTWLGGWFAPKTRFGIRVRNWTTNLMNAPLLSSWMVNRLLADRFELPEETNAYNALVHHE